MSKFDVVNEAGTNGISYGIATADIIETLKHWDTVYGLQISHVDHDFILVEFQSLPDHPARLAEEIYGICPDVLRLQLACADEMLETLRASGRSALTRGDRLDDEELGLVLLAQTLKSTRAAVLWWDATSNLAGDTLNVA